MKILYFASLREKIGKDSEEITGITTLGNLKTFLNEKYQFDTTILSAVNLKMINDEHFALKETDEVAFYPPVTGG